MMDKKTIAYPAEDAQIISGVLKEFYDMCAIPHRSWHEEALSQTLEQRLKSRGWEVERDGVGNLRAEIPASPGKEKLPLVALQGHIDMVCAVAEGSGWDPERDCVQALVTDGVLHTDGRSSLGADNNLGNAAVLYLMDQSFSHGPIRLIFTVAEEVGLQGATAMDPAWLSGVRYLINTDGFQLGRAIISSAGGRREQFLQQLHTVPRSKNIAYRLELSGSVGGHSGNDINKGRTNCIKQLAVLLGQMREDVDYELADFGGGHALNAIPLEAYAVILVDEAVEERMRAHIDRTKRGLTAVYRHSDPMVHLAVKLVPPPKQVWHGDSRDHLLDLVALLHDGVFAMHDTMPGLVSASSNIGAVRVSEDGELEVDCFVRSAGEFTEEIIGYQHGRLAQLNGFRTQLHRYPGWAGDADNPLAKKMAEIYRRLIGKEMEITAVHVGLEPGVLGAKNPDMIMVSTGPDIHNPHSVDESAPVAGIATYVHLLQQTLEEIV